MITSPIICPVCNRFVILVEDVVIDRQAFGQEMVEVRRKRYRAMDADHDVEVAYVIQSPEPSDLFISACRVQKQGILSQ